MRTKNQEPISCAFLGYPLTPVSQALVLLTIRLPVDIVCRSIFVFVFVVTVVGSLTRGDMQGETCFLGICWSAARPAVGRSAPGDPDHR